MIRYSLELLPIKDTEASGQKSVKVSITLISRKLGSTHTFVIFNNQKSSVEKIVEKLKGRKDFLMRTSIFTMIGGGKRIEFESNIAFITSSEFSIPYSKTNAKVFRHIMKNVLDLLSMNR